LPAPDRRTEDGLAAQKITAPGDTRERVVLTKLNLTEVGQRMPAVHAVFLLA